MPPASASVGATSSSIDPARRFIVHVGRQKSGTSSLQWALERAGESLAQQGVCYPVAGREGAPGHHRLARAVLNGEISSIHEWLSDDEAGAARVVVSSERLQNVEPEALGAVFPPSETCVVVYFREQVSFLLSAYAQRVQATTATEPLDAYLDQRVKQPAQLDYAERCAAFVRVFGADGLRARIYDQEWLVGASVIDDFAGLIDLRLQADVGRRNPSIPRELVRFKRIANAMGVGDHFRYAELGRLAGRYPRSLPAIDAGRQAAIRARYASSNQRLFSEFIDSTWQDFRYDDLAGPSDSVDVDELVSELLELVHEIQRNRPERAG